jgi:RNA polymerase sigma-70 factor (ECF subfamily)
MNRTSETDVGELVEHLFRQESGRIVSTLVGIFGLQNLSLAEDAVQEAMLKALRQWSFGTIPSSPSAWLMQVAKNRALDVLRRDSRWRGKEQELARVAQSETMAARNPASAPASDEIRDDQLRMMFACCHPALSRDAQVALTLKTLGGFNVAEIARAFLIGEETAAKRLTRARQALQDSGARFEIPEGDALSVRLEAVHDVLYLLFNEGHNASRGSELIRHDVSREAIRLARLLAADRATSTPATCALLALFLLQAARFASRVALDGDLLVLEQQDRATWDKQLIAQGLSWLDRAASGEKLSRFHFEAGIAACHSTAPSYAATDWAQILALYDGLLTLNNSPVVALNRAVALGKVRGPREALAAVHALEAAPALQRYHLLYAVRGELYAEAGDEQKAGENYARALELTNIPAEKQLLRERMRQRVAPR